MFHVFSFFCTPHDDGTVSQGYAIKTIKKSKVSRIESLRREIEILRCVDHPCIIKLYDVYEDDRFIHLVTELCTGGELFDRIIQKTESEEGHYSEKDAKVCVWCFFCVVWWFLLIRFCGFGGGLCVAVM